MKTLNKRDAKLKGFTVNKTLKSILTRIINGKRADWEDQLGAALSAYRISTSTVTKHSPYMLHYARPPRYPLTRLLAEDESRNFSNRLQTQADVMQEVSKAIADSRIHNRERLARKANASDIQVGDRVIIKAREPLSLTAKWDFGFTVTKVNGKVLTLLHPTTGVKQLINRDQVRLVNPDMAWDQVNPRPIRTRAKPRIITGKRPSRVATPPPAPADDVIPTDNAHAQTPDSPLPDAQAPAIGGADNEMETDVTALPLPDSPVPTETPIDVDDREPLPRLRLKRLSEEAPRYNLRSKRARWDCEQIAVLDFCAKWHGQYSS